MNSVSCSQSTTDRGLPPHVVVATSSRSVGHEHIRIEQREAVVERDDTR
jgi:hypothetical protein